MIFGRLATEVRRPFNDLVTLFLGDVFVYLTRRGGPAAGGTVPGPIPQALLDGLTKARQLQVQTGGDEPLVVLTHSMGGQIVYDAVTHFLPNLPEHVGTRIDFWCATASQVGLFEEMKLFLASNPAHGKPPKPKVPFPDRRQLGAWWNVWDHNDFISFTAEEIFEGVDDESYATGYSLIEAHSGYLKRPSFFRRFAEKLQVAKSKNWYRP
jgi:hypothetical protein